MTGTNDVFILGNNVNEVLSFLSRNLQDMEFLVIREIFIQNTENIIVKFICVVWKLNFIASLVN